MSRYLVAVLATAAVVLVQIALGGLAGEDAPILLFVAAVAASAWHGGLWPGLLATALSTVAGALYFLGRDGWRVRGAGDHARLALFVAAGVLISGLCEAMRRRGRAIEEARETSDRAAEEARRSREQLQVTLASVGDAIITTDDLGRVSYLNAVAEALTGWTIAEAAGLPLPQVFRIVNEATRETVEDPATRALRDGAVVGLANHTILLAKDGAERLIDDSAAPIRDGAGHVSGCVLVFRDVSERRRAERALRESEARKSAMFDTALDCIISIDHEGTIVEFNASAERTFGHRRDDVIGKELAALIIPPAYREGHRRGLAHYLATGEGPVLNQRVELSALRADGEEFPIELTVTRIPVDGPAIFTAYLRDITERRVAEQALRDSEAFSRTVFESSPDCVKVLDADGRLERMNANGLCLLEIDDFAGMRGRSWCELWPAGGEQDLLASLAAARAHGVGKFQGFCPTAKGMSKWWDVVVAPVRDQAGEVVRFVSVSRDVTDRKAAEDDLRESKERLQFVMDSMPQKIFTATPTGDVDYFNPVWTEFTGLSFAQIRNWGWTQFTHPDDVEENVEVWQHSIETGEPFQFEHRFRRADGEYRWHLSRAVSQRNAEGRIVMWVGSNTDIHEQRETANRLRQFAADLSEADRRKNEFLAMLAHELRNPLAPIRNAVQILRMTHGDGAGVQSASEMMERQVGQMVRLVDDLLDVSRITRGKIELRRERVELALALSQAVEAARALPQCAGKGLVVSLPPNPVYVDADPARLAQVVGNLLNNACKFTDEGGRVQLSAAEEAGEVAIRVRDDGVGLAADQQSRIFDMFVQVDTSLERSVSGLGIGLTLVKRLVEMHGGSVAVRSEGLGRGSEFEVRLPVAAGSPEPPRPRPAPVAAARRILVVDDNEDSANSLARLLNLTGNEARTAYDGLQAVEVAEAHRPEWILMDIGLPGLNGYEACRRIREKSWGEHMVIVALTGWGQEEDRTRSKEAGFDGHLVKPVDFQALAKMLAEMVPHGP